MACLLNLGGPLSIRASGARPGETACWEINAEKLRGAGHTAKNSADKDADKTAEQKQNDTRAMGASGSSKADSSRQARMDEAYANSKKSKPMDK